MNPIFLKRKEVEEVTALSYSTFNRLEKEGRFPKRIHIADSRVGWAYKEILDWAKSLSNSPSHA